DEESDDVAYREGVYGAVKSLFNATLRRRPKTDPVQVARFLYLNYRGFNGLFRTNRQGEYNVAFGGLRKTPLPTLAVLTSVSQALQGAELFCSDFAPRLSEAGPGDVVYADPPYNGTFEYGD